MVSLVSRPRRASIVLAATHAFAMFVALTEAARWDNGTQGGDAALRE
jgi:hypothetical protein